VKCTSRCRGKDFRTQVAEIVAERAVRKFGDSRLFMAVRLCMRDRRGSDRDNRLKALCDAHRACRRIRQ
jgi:Holliday junction resolvase RusA-like endonuclease